MKKRIFKNISIFGIILFSMSFLSSCTDKDGNEYSPINGEDILNKLFPNVWALLAQLISFLILVILMIFLVYKPVKNYLNKRKQMLDDEVKITNENKKIAIENALSSEKEIANSKEKAKQIINDAELKATKDKDEILESARNEAASIIKNASESIKRSEEEAKAELKNQIVVNALEASKKVLEREVNDSDNTKIIEDFVNELTNNKEKDN